MTPGLPADPARELSRLPRPRLLAATVGIVAILSGLRLVQVVSLSSRRLVTEDAATLWLAGHDMLNGQLRQPTFPGQHYGVPFEGLGPALLQHVGVPPWWGQPVTLAALVYASCLFLAAAAWRAGAPVAALAAAGAPLLLATYPLFYVTSYGTGLGRCLAAAAAAVLWCGIGVRSAFVGALCAGLAVVFDPSTLLLVGPVVVVAVARRWRADSSRAWRAAALGVLPAVSWLLVTSRFADVHPDYGLNPAPSPRPHWDALTDVLQDLPHYFGIFAPAAWPRGGVALGAVAAVLLLALFAGSRVAAIGAAMAVVVLLGLLATQRAADDVSAFLPGSRVMLSLPLVCLFLLGVWEADLSRRWSARLHTRLCLAAVLVLAGSCVRGLIDANGDARQIRAAAAAAPVVPELRSEDVRARCLRLRDVVAETKTSLVVFATDRAVAYGCPAAFPGGYRTLFAPYEKRTWRLYEERVARPTRLLVWDSSCGAAETQQFLCRVLPGEPPVAVVSPAGQTTLEVVRALGITVRAFGPGCEPPHPATCIEDYWRLP